MIGDHHHEAVVIGPELFEAINDLAEQMICVTHFGQVAPVLIIGSVAILRASAFGRNRTDPGRCIPLTVEQVV